jgi:hypothetical protein
LLREIRGHVEKAPEKRKPIVLRCPILLLSTEIMVSPPIISWERTRLDPGFQDKRVDFSQFQIVVMTL